MLDEKQIQARLPLWEALSSLWLDTEVTADDLEWIARVMADSGLTIAELWRVYSFEGICLSESPHDFAAFKTFLHYLPYSSLRVRLASELPVAQRPAIRARLREALSALPASAADATIRAYKRNLSEAGDRDKCDEAVKRVGRAMAIDARLSDADIQSEIDLYEKVRGPMPYPSPGTACALFGFQEAAHAALGERRTRRNR